MCKFSLYMETKIPIRLNIFDTEDFLVSLLREDFLGRLLDSKIKYMRRLRFSRQTKILLKFRREYVRILFRKSSGSLPEKSSRCFPNHNLIK